MAVESWNIFQVMRWPIHSPASGPTICPIRTRWSIEPSATVAHRGEDDKAHSSLNRHSIPFLCNRHCSMLTRRWTESHRRRSQDKVKWNSFWPSFSTCEDIFAVNHFWNCCCSRVPLDIARRKQKEEKIKRSQKITFQPSDRCPIWAWREFGARIISLLLLAANT